MSSIEEETPFLSSRNDTKSDETPSDAKITRDHRFTIATASMLMASILFIISGFRYPTDTQCINQMSTWSPMLEAVEYEWRHFKTEGPNHYYGKPSDHLEASWGELWECR